MRAAPEQGGRRTIWGVLAVLLTAAVVGAPPARADSLTFRYVANTGAWSDLYLATQQPTPAGHTAPSGWFSFTSTGSSFTLRFDDPTLIDGQTVPVRIDQLRPDGTHTTQMRCLPVRATTTFLSVAGARVGVIVSNEASWWVVYSRPCGLVGSHAGTAYVGR